MSADESAKSLEIIRRQRHDFLNHLQVLSGLLQLRRPEQALNYIKEVAKELEDLGGVLRLRCPRLALALLGWSIEAQHLDIRVRLAGSPGVGRFELDEEKTIRVVEGVWRAVTEALQNLPGDRRWFVLRLAEEEGGLCLIWQLGANDSLTEACWPELLKKQAALAREINGELAWEQEGDHWLLRLRLPAETGA